MTNFKTSEGHLFNTKHFIIYLFKWTICAVIIGIPIGCASALFLYLLEQATTLRNLHPSLLYLLPLGGLFVGLLYHYYGGRANKGNNLLIEEYYAPTNVIPFKMAPLVLLGTIITHLFGGSAGREGTAVQMGGAIADQLSRLIKLTTTERKTLLLMGISAGFASVFGTPLAGILFAFELMHFRKVHYSVLFPSILVAFIANATCSFWGIVHSHYIVSLIPSINFLLLLKIGIAGILFGLTAWLFIKTTEHIAIISSTYLTYPPIKPFIGAIIFILAITIIGDYQYLGLGLPTLSDAFIHSQGGEVFILKLLLTALTLGVGFKGGEVTPLFFIGATLGSFLAPYFNLEISFLAALGFIGVFAGATKTPIACIVMGLELFGVALFPYLTIAVLLAYLTSGARTIYSAQKTTRFHSYINHIKNNTFTSQKKQIK
ncbi:MAG: chloride channel protein [Flavobacteriaceae bacterium]|jgi:H+/Cl- antiporter ClcA|nr:chloride channel protein [Flavobacteriaceae bacterium]